MRVRVPVPVPQAVQPRELGEHLARWQAIAAQFLTLEQIQALQDDGVPDEHVFDLASGLRLLLTAEDYGYGARYVHCAAIPMRPLSGAFMMVCRDHGLGLAGRRLASLAVGSAAAITGIPVARWRQRIPLPGKRQNTIHWFAEIEP